MNRPSQLVSGLCVAVAAWHLYLAFIGLVQLGVMAAFIPASVFSDLAGGLRDRDEAPRAMAWVYAHFPEFALLSMTLSLATATYALGAWRRKQWGRLGSMVCLTLQVLLNLITPLVMIPYVFSAVPSNAHVLAKIFMAAVAVLSTLHPVVFALGYAWLLYTLTRPEVRAEFS